MGKIISASIDLTKVNKDKLVTGKKGGKWLNLSIFINDTTDQYGNDVSIAENQSKDERQAGEKKVYLGNGKIVHDSGLPKTPEQPQQKQSSQTQEDDLPF